MRSAQVRALTTFTLALVGGIAFVAADGLLNPALAQTPPPSPAQIEQFRQLPADQQRALMEQQGLAPDQVRDEGLEEADELAVEDAVQDHDRDGECAFRDPETGLSLFGYDLFCGVPSTFAPVTDIPVPVDYVVGPGDRVSVQLFGNRSGSFELVVNRDGAVNFPELGPVTVSGMPFDEMRRMLRERVSQQMIGVSASITMGELRSIRVFVMGEARRPGTYTVSSLSTITNALFVSGGARSIGSLRNIQLMRNGQQVASLDLYDLLLRGDTRADVRLKPGDVLFIPPVGPQVGIRGEVRRPAMYELKSETTAGQMINLAGGFTAQAYPQRSALSRITPFEARVLEDLDLRSAAGQARHVRSGDVIRVPSVLDGVLNVVTLQGHVFRPGPVQYRSGMRLTDLIPSLNEVQSMPDLNYVLIRRQLPPDGRVVAVSADLQAALSRPGGHADIELKVGDEVRVFSLAAARPGVEALLDELRLQATLDAPMPVVRIGGRVRAPGTYPLEPGMRVRDLVRAGGALAESAYITDAEITRYAVINGEYREVDLISVNLAAIRGGDSASDLILQPYDFLNVRQVTDWREQETVTLRGEVRFPGTYPIRKGETLLSVLERAGGLTDRAYAYGAIMTREELREREGREIRRLVDRLEADLAALALQEAQSGSNGGADTLGAGRLLLSDLRATTPVGRLAMDLRRVLAAEPGSDQDILLEDGDQLMIPGLAQSISVIGEVQSPTSILWERGLTREDYINLSGGVTRRADARRIYIVRANGQVTTSSGGAWFRKAETGIQPGDTIVVPSDIERMRPLPLWTSVTTIIYNMAVTAAAISRI